MWRCSLQLNVAAKIEAKLLQQESAFFPDAITILVVSHSKVCNEMRVCQQA